jgi:hypothetical protein
MTSALKSAAISLRVSGIWSAGAGRAFIKVRIDPSGHGYPSRPPDQNRVLAILVIWRCGVTVTCAVAASRIPSASRN